MKELWKSIQTAVKEDYRKWRASCRDPKCVRSVLIKGAILCLVCLLSVMILVLSVSGAIVDRGSERVSSHETVDGFVESYGKEYDCILVLGCGVKEDGTPSDRLRDRVKVGVMLYEAGVAPKLLMSGDHGSESYDEVTAMLKLAIELGVPKEDI